MRGNWIDTSVGPPILVTRLIWSNPSFDIIFLYKIFEKFQNRKYDFTIFAVFQIASWLCDFGDHDNCRRWDVLENRICHRTEIYFRRPWKPWRNNFYPGDNPRSWPRSWPRSRRWRLGTSSTMGLCYACQFSCRMVSLLPKFYLRQA